MTLPFKVSSIEKEGLMHCSKWLRHAVLFTLEEWNDFSSAIGNPMFVVTTVVDKSSWQVSASEFKDKYLSYLEHVKQEASLPSPAMRRFFTLMISPSIDDFYAVEVGGGRFIIKPRLPVIQMQMYHAFISDLDRQIHPMVLHPQSFSFGLQFSYPQIYEDPVSHTFSKVLLDSQFPSSDVFKKMVQWFRANTKPVSILLDGKTLHAPFRQGKASSELVRENLGLQKALSRA